MPPKASANSSIHTHDLHIWLNLLPAVMTSCSLSSSSSSCSWCPSSLSLSLSLSSSSASSSMVRVNECSWGSISTESTLSEICTQDKWHYRIYSGVQKSQTTDSCWQLLFSSSRVTSIHDMYQMINSYSALSGWRPGLDELHVLASQQAIPHFINTSIHLCQHLTWLVSAGREKLFSWTHNEFFSGYSIMMLDKRSYLPSPHACPNSPVCFSSTARTKRDTVSNRVSLGSDALSQSTNTQTCIHTASINLGLHNSKQKDKCANVNWIIAITWSKNFIKSLFTWFVKI